MYKIIFNNERLIKKDLELIPDKFRQNIFKKLENLAINWLKETNIKLLNHYSLCDYRLRVWNYRILFNLNSNNNQIIIFRILHRSKLY